MRKKRSFAQKQLRRRIVCVLAALTVLLPAWRVATNMRSVISVYVLSNAETVLSDAANQAVCQILEDEGVSYQDLVELKRGTADDVLALEINTVLVNRLKARMTSEISAVLAAREKARVPVPVGSLLGHELFWGRGPSVPFRVDLSGTVLSDFQSRFESAGINQTLHQIVVEVSAQAHIAMPFYQKTSTVKTTFLIAQTVVVGKVPEAYTYVFDDDREDVVGDIFDYGAATG